MERFVRRENIKRYRRLLREMDDDAERRRISMLLKEEEQKGGVDKLNDWAMFREQKGGFGANENSKLFASLSLSVQRAPAGNPRVSKSSTSRQFSQNKGKTPACARARL